MAQRMVMLEGGARTGIKLDDITWKYVELAAKKGGHENFREFCKVVIAEADRNGKNRTDAIRNKALTMLYPDLERVNEIQRLREILCT